MNCKPAGPWGLERSRSPWLQPADSIYAYHHRLELLELYVELILARFGLLEMNPKEKEPDEGVREAVCSIVYAAPRWVHCRPVYLDTVQPNNDESHSIRTEIRELQIIREAFMSRYGRDWAISCMENTNGHVSPRVLSKCKLETPAKDWVDLYLYEISKAYQINWRPEGLALDGAALDGDTELDTAAQEQRVSEAKVTSDKTSKSDDADDPSGGGGDFLNKLPSAPSGLPHLTDVKNSTTSIPIIKRDEKEDQHTTVPHKPGEIFDLPTTPPLDPAQSARTVIIKSNLGHSPNSKGNVSSSSTQAPPQKSADSSYEVSPPTGSSSQRFVLM